jgi:hypothetical protein
MKLKTTPFENVDEPLWAKAFAAGWHAHKEYARRSEIEDMQLRSKELYQIFKTKEAIR